MGELIYISQTDISKMTRRELEFCLKTQSKPVWVKVYDNYGCDHVGSEKLTPADFLEIGKRFAELDKEEY